MRALASALAIWLAATLSGAAGAQDAKCALTRGQVMERLAAEAYDAASADLVRAIRSGDFLLGAKYYGYLMGRRLQNAAAGSEDRACALQLDTALDTRFAELSEAHQMIYRLALTGALDPEIEGMYRLDLPSWAATPVTAPQLDHGAEAPWSDWLPVTDIAGEPPDIAGEPPESVEPVSAEEASEAVCPAGGDPEFSAAWLRFQRWVESEYLDGASRYAFRWTDMRPIWGQAVSRVAAAVEDRPERAAALACIEAQLDAIVDAVGRTASYDAETERRLLREAVEGGHDDEAVGFPGVSSRDPAPEYFEQLGGDVGVDLAGDYAEPVEGDAAGAGEASGDDAASEEAAHPWDGLCSRDQLAEAGYTPVFAQTSTVYSNVYVFIDPVDNEYVHLVGCERVRFDMQEFEAAWEELDTVYPEDGPYSRVVNYKNRSRNEWTSLVYY